ncbi:uncharacterized protein RCC_01294 [Ramularia collo-cygni]|uniref:PH domain-containing protein n=1 Tax=Ramularia collo-cygni TaxID=112498 RepID=A0A2D3UWJ0_9PEZI|nr:uncharacterized protein RCC_01294 [Ramularia collo-cygni]CZT15436.1 uncharacterized protein RCC_01294 [Ramularia collo-cygni]
MATANLPPGAVPTNAEDPFTSGPSQSSAPLRYGAFDNEQFSLYSTNSPSAARRALEAHLKDTDRRIQDASKLGSTLVQQRRDLAAKLKEVEQMQQDGEVPDDLRNRLAELEREYNEIGQDTARAFLPRGRIASDTAGPDGSPVISGSGRESPTKLSMPSRRQRNQPTHRVHDIEFATEISTSLLAQVRQLQAALAEKDEALRDTNAAKSHLESEAASLVQRIRHMDESEQKYKDENWTLETRLQEMEATLKHTTDKENRLAQTLMALQAEKAAKERELDDLRVSHDKLSEEQAMTKRIQETDLHGLRRDAASHETEKQRLTRRIDELTIQNTELAKAVSYRLAMRAQPSDTDFVSAEEGVRSDDDFPDHSEPTSPIKGTPARHGMLESETLKSSLNHAHRMIQNLKNNIHREKTEKLELKRMLQDARDELETRRDSAAGANATKKPRASDGIKFKRPSKPLGAARPSTTEILADEPEWEDSIEEQTPSKPRPRAHQYGGSSYDAETTDADFETANERDTTTESEAFATGNEDFGDDTEGDLTETEADRSMHSSAISTKPGDRRSYMSTASTDDEEGSVSTPVQNGGLPKYKLRLGRGGVRRSAGYRVGSERSGSESIGTPQRPAQTLGDELEGMDDDSNEGTPASLLSNRDEALDYGLESPETTRAVSVGPETPSRSTILPTLAPPFVEARAAMVDAGVMTEPWEPEQRGVTVADTANAHTEATEAEPQTLRERAGDLVGGALAGFGLSRVIGHSSGQEAERPVTPKAELPEVNLQRRDWGSDAFSHSTQQRHWGSDAFAHSTQQRHWGSDAFAHSTQQRHWGSDAFGHSLGQEAERPVTPKADLPEVILQQRDWGSDAFSHSPPKEKKVTAAPFQQSEIFAQETEPISPPRPAAVETLSAAPSQSQTSEAGFQSVQSPRQVDIPAVAPVLLSFSHIQSQDIEPVEAPEEFDGLVGATSSLAFADELHEIDTRQDVHDNGDVVPGADVDARGDIHGIPGTANAAPGAALMSSSRQSSDAIPAPERSAQVIQLPPMADEGSQTLVSGEDIDRMIKDKKAAVFTPIVQARDVTDAGSSPLRVSTSSAAATPGSPTRRLFPDSSARPSVFDSPTLRAPLRPSSAGSGTARVFLGAPPLPPDHTEKIAAAAQSTPTPAGGVLGANMGPPNMPASAYKPRPKTPASRDGPTPRQTRPIKEIRPVASQSDRISHRTSVSSFASELDERFNITRGHIMYPTDVEPATDPRMIQAITQTMIGEYLWKYTRKAGRSETSTTRHRRFFWIHPYTRTLYWSEQDPSTAGKNMLKAKSVAIDAVRVISDDNAYPPGLHRKTIVVVTPGREIVFTAPTGQRHETWFNALSYLLLRTEGIRREAEDQLTQDELNEFNPAVGFAGTVKASIAKATGRSQSKQSRTSLSSYNSRTTRTSSPQRYQYSTTGARDGAISQASYRTATTNRSTGPEQPVGSKSNRAFSSMASRFHRPGSSHASRTRRSSSLARRNLIAGDPAAIYDASVVGGDSAEDLRAVIERQEREAGVRLENVRACCDGEYIGHEVST